MCDLNICRICLISNVRGYELTNKLQQFYELILDCQVNLKDKLPTWVCYECATLLQKYHKFREKCANGKLILEQVLQKGQITYKAIRTINRHKEKLNSNITITSSSAYIKTYNIRHRGTKIHRRKAKKPIEAINNKFPIEFIEEYIPPEVTSSKIKEESDQIENHDDLFNHNDFSIDDNDDIIINNDISIRNELNIDNTNNKTLVNKLSKRPDMNISSDSEDDIPLSNKSILLNQSKRIIDENDISTNKNINPNNIHTENDNTPLSTKNNDNNFNHKESNEIKVRVYKNNKKNTKLIHRVNNNDKSKNTGKIKKYAKKKKEFLTPKFWDQVKLPEDEAMAEFKKKQSDSKYMNAEYKCEKCFKTFSNFDIMERHMKLRHDEKKGTFECRFCHMRFRVKCKLAYHMMEHYTVYNCLRCDRKFTVFSSAMYHEQFHNGVTKKCEHCGKEFTHNSSYYTHIRMKHRSTHVCTLCGASFVSEAGLAQHKRITHVVNNTDVSESCDNYCDKCDITFLTRAAYDEHLVNSKLHVDNTDDPSNFKEKQKKAPKKRDNVICSYCGSWFLTSSACYKHHVARHPHAPPPSLGPRHVCELCGVSIALASLKSHMNLHLGSKHCCVTCGMQFTTKGAHDRHQVTHTGEKPYACTLCDKRFTQRGGVLLHHRTFHLKQPYPQRNRKKKTDEVSSFP